MDTHEANSAKVFRGTRKVAARRWNAASAFAAQTIFYNITYKIIY